MRHHQWQGVGLGRAQVEEMNVEAIDPSRRRIEGVEPRFARTPVVAIEPVGAQRLHPCQGRTLTPVVHCLALRPTCARQALTQIVERRVGEGEGVSLDCIVHGRLLIVAVFEHCAARFFGAAAS
jgi:hypothetical protein